MPLAVLAVVAAGALLLQGRIAESDVRPPPGGPPRVGAPAPDFALRDLDGNAVRLSAIRGERVIISFWATWCPPCRVEMPALDRVDREYRGRGVTVLAVNQMEVRETVVAFRSELSLGLKLLLDSQGETARLYRVYSLPTTAFVDSDGMVEEVHSGALSYDDLARWVQTPRLATTRSATQLVTKEATEAVVGKRQDWPGRLATTH